MRIVKVIHARTVGIHIISLIFLSSIIVFFSVHPSKGSQETSPAQHIIFSIIARKDTLKSRHDRFPVVHRNNGIAPSWFFVQDSTAVSGQSAVLRDTVYSWRAMYACGERSPPFSATLS
ncbi:MAG: hypothetical protein M1591_06475 [Deltaproteobacteria bacterium]|nr:hypothetical protein [Deltaproteobacteria bacterium]